MKLNPWKLSTFALAGLLAASMSWGALQSADAQQRQPHMRAAMTATKTAIRQLKKAAPNKGGHRTKAIKALEAAASEIHLGMSHTGAK